MVTSPPDPQEVAALRALMDGFIQERLQLKLDKLKGDADEVHAQSLALQQAHVRETWVADAVQRVKKIQLITHSLKGIHSAARGTNIYLDAPVVQSMALVGTHVLKSDRTDDVASDSGAAFLGKDVTDVVELLTHELNGDGVSLLTRFKRQDATMLQALTDDLKVAQKWVEIFSKITDESIEATSHTLAKQLYFPTQGDDYHLLAPLFPTSLAHGFYKAIQEDRFHAAKNKKESDQVRMSSYRSFPGIAVRYLGGANPINVSVLNNKRYESERKGANHLLAGVPPVWKDQGTKPPLRMASVFDMKRGVIGRDRTLVLIVKALRLFLKSVVDVDNNMHIRDKRAELVQAIIDRVLDIATELQCLNGGWSADPACKLSWAQKQWLDVDALEAAQAAYEETQTAPSTATDSVSAAPVATEWRESVAEDFARWFNATISTDKTPMGDDEFVKWKYTFLESL